MISHQAITALLAAGLLAGCTTGDNTTASGENIFASSDRPFPEGPGMPFPEDERYEVKVRTFDVTIQPNDETLNCVEVNAREGSPLLAVFGTATAESLEGRLRLVARANNNTITSQGASPLELNFEFARQSDNPAIVFSVDAPNAIVDQIIHLSVMAGYDGDEAPLMALSRC